ncbi:MAG: MATE family efflux transporter, partial [Bacteroidota bacterium]
MAAQNYKQHLKTNFNLAYPVMLSQLGHMMVNVADSVMVGQLGVLPLAGVSLANGIFHVVMTFGIGITYAITPFVAAADGEGNTARSSEFLKHAILINTVTGVLIFTLILVGGDILYYLDQPEDVVEAAIPYLNILAFSMIPLMLFQTLRQFMEGLSHTKQAMIIIIGSNLINIGLNYVLIYGKLGFPELGLIGAGWASLISRIALAAVIYAFVYFNKRFRAYREGFRLTNFKKHIIRKLLGIGLPAG